MNLAVGAAEVNEFVMGASAMASFIVAARFGRYWRDTGDHLFWKFALAFLIIGLSWPGAWAGPPPGEVWSPSCLVGLAAHLLILWAIVEKNRSQRPHGKPEGARSNGFHRRPRP
jgi:hypothetical protein